MRLAEGEVKGEEVELGSRCIRKTEGFVVLCRL